MNLYPPVGTIDQEDVDHFFISSPDGKNDRD